MTVRKLKIGDTIEVDGELYDIVRDEDDRVTLEPTITETVDEIFRRVGGRPLTHEEFEARFGHLPSDDEG